MSATAGPKLALKAQFMLNSGTFASPVWSNVSLVGDATVSPDWEKADASIRGQRLVQNVKTMLGLSFSAKVRADDTDINYGTIWSAANNDTILNVLILDGPLSQQGPRGYWIDVQVFKNTQDQGLKNIIYTDFEFMPTPSVNQQSSVVIGASSTITSSVIGT